MICFLHSQVILCFHCHEKNIFFSPEFIQQNETKSDENFKKYLSVYLIDSLGTKVDLQSRESDEMIQLLFTIAFLEMFVALSLLFETPIRSLLILGLGWMKLGHGQLVAGTVAATFSVVFTSSLLGLMSFLQSTSESGRMNPTDEVLMANSLLETSLMGNPPIFLFAVSVLQPTRTKLHALSNHAKLVISDEFDKFGFATCLVHDWH